MKNIKVGCECGAVQGTIAESDKPKGRRLACYCQDCQTFAHYLGKGESILDPEGGTDIYQVAPSQLTIQQGTEKLRCVRLSPKGLFRWYAECCNTPIGNTVSASIPFMGVVHNFFQTPPSLDQTLGPVSMFIQTKTAKNKVSGENVYETMPPTLMIKTIGKLIYRSVTGQGKPNPFFNDKSDPIVAPIILTKEQRHKFSNQ